MSDGPMWGDWNRPGNRERVDALWHKLMGEQIEKEDRLYMKRHGMGWLQHFDWNRLVDDARD